MRNVNHPERSMEPAVNPHTVIRNSVVGLPMAVLGDSLQRHQIPWQDQDERLQLALTRRPGAGDVVLYVHGATFPIALSADWRMEGISWLDHWQQSGLDAWALDFAGYGSSDRPTAFNADALASPPFGRLAQAASQVGAALRHIRHQRPDAPIHLVAHSWGTLPAQQAAIDNPAWVSRLVLFGPVVTRDGVARSRERPAWALIDEAQQRPRHRTGLPDHEPTPVSEAEIDRWCAAYLQSDPTATGRTTPAVKVPDGPGADLEAMWAGETLVNSALIHQPTLIVRGNWDHVTTDQDARRLFDALSGTRDKRDIKIAGGNHWLHLQPRRGALWAETLLFLQGSAHA